VSGLWDDLNKIYGALFLRDPPVYTFGRGGACVEGPEFDDESQSNKASVTPLEKLPVVLQRIEANLPLIEAAWKTDNYGADISVQLIRDNGSIVVRKDVCHGNDTVLLLPSPGFQIGERLTLLIGSETQPELKYRITVVEPQTLEQTGRSTAANWAYGAWLLAKGPLDLRLDAVSWLATGQTSFAAFRILSAVQTEENYQ
jgi:hypothetical protein